MTYRQLIYMVLDEIKQINNDSTITEDHVKFLANLYRYFLLYLKKQKEGLDSLSTSNELTICVNLQPVSAVPGLDYCTGTYLKSEEKIPDLMDMDTAKVAGVNQFLINIALVSRERFKYVGYNRWMQHIIYCTLGADHHLYFSGNNPLFSYLREAKLTGVFEDGDKANELACEAESDANYGCDPLDKEFPLDAELIPQLIELLVKELSAMAWRQNDDKNNSTDDLANLVAYLQRNVKSDLAKLISS